MKLNLASGTDLRNPPWVNLDIVAQWPCASRGCDVIWDARRDPIPFPDGSVDEVYAGYLFLHLAPCYHERNMREIYRVLQPGGVLVLGEVDMDIVMRRWLDNPEDKSANELIFGEQGVIHGVDLSDYDKHCAGFTESSLRNFATRFGFSDLERIRVHNEAVWYELTIRCRK